MPAALIYLILGIPIIMSPGSEHDDVLRSRTIIDEYDERFRIMGRCGPGPDLDGGLDKLCYFFNQPWLDFTGGHGAGDGQRLGGRGASGRFRSLPSHIHTAFDAREDFRMEYRLRRYDGQYRWILDTGRKIVDENGDFRGYIGSCMDIQDMKDAEERNAFCRTRFIEPKDGRPLEPWPQVWLTT